MEARLWKINDLMEFNWTSGFSSGDTRLRWFIRKRDGVDRDVIAYLNPRPREDASAAKVNDVSP